ncbi:MAG: PKD domain-containing protein [Anaerolineales bacterium]|nr:PKD domain-containing protein [Anaerolineales bacterium]
MRHRHFIRTLVLLLVCLLFAVPVFAQQLFPEITVTPSIDCIKTQFDILIADAAVPYQVEILFGDGEGLVEEDVESTSLEFEYTYPGEGVYAWTVTVVDAAGTVLSSEGEILLEGVDAALNSMPFPPILTWQEGGVNVEFLLEATGSNSPKTAQWDLDGDGIWELEGAPVDVPQIHVYAEPGIYQAAVRVSDSCGFVDTDTLLVVIEERNEEEPADDGSCHPAAVRIADALALLPDGLVEQDYTCEQIEGFFNGDLTGSQLGFGRMWHAYRLVSDFETLTWEQVRDWHLDGTGWGLLLQLDRWSDTMADLELGPLVGSVLSGDVEIKDVRQAVRTASLYDVPYEDVMVYIDQGLNTGDLNQLFKLAKEYGLTQADLTAYMEAGYSVVDIKQAVSFADRTGLELTVVLEQHAAGTSWGEMHKETRDLAEEAQRDEDQSETPDHAQGNPSSQENKDQRTAEQLARQYDCSVEEVTALYSSECDWPCVRSQLRDGAADPADEDTSTDDKDQRTAERYASQYSVSIDNVWALFNGECNSDWQCVRKILHDN